MGAGLNRAEIILLFVAQFGFPQQGTHPDDAIHWCANFMAHGGEERALGKRRITCCIQSFVEFKIFACNFGRINPHLVIQLFLQGDVLRLRNQIHGLPLFIPHRRNPQIGQHPMTITMTKPLFHLCNGDFQTIWLTQYFMDDYRILRVHKL
ncbi:MAG TPA: hypothetical protein VFZ34_33525 [Blastocatellia bacterium]|nr:hypothetical protein [Blastocatellia bacterium]